MPGLSVAFRTFSCGLQDRAPLAGIEPRAPALAARSFSHWTIWARATLKTSSILLPSVLFALSAPLPHGSLYAVGVSSSPLLVPKGLEWGDLFSFPPSPGILCLHPQTQCHNCWEQWHPLLLYHGPQGRPLMLETQLLCAGAILNPRHRVLGEVKMNVPALPGKGGHSSSSPQNCVSQPGGIWWGVLQQSSRAELLIRIRLCAGLGFLKSGRRWSPPSFCPSVLCYVVLSHSVMSDSSRPHGP